MPDPTPTESEVIAAITDDERRLYEFSMGMRAAAGDIARRQIEAAKPDLTGRHPDHPLPTLEWHGESPKPKSWWGRNASGALTKVYRDYAAYCDD